MIYLSKFLRQYLTHLHLSRQVLLGIFKPCHRFGNLHGITPVIRTLLPPPTDRRHIQDGVGDKSVKNSTKYLTTPPLALYKFKQFRRFATHGRLFWSS